MLKGSPSKKLIRSNEDPVIRKNGQVGWELNRFLLPLGEMIAYGREDADFSNPESLRKIVQNV